MKLLKRRLPKIQHLVLIAVFTLTGGMPAVSQSPTPTAAEPSRAAQHKIPAKQLFGRKRRAAALRPQAIGFYSRGCLAGAERLEINGPAWQAMRLSRNRNWGHPRLVQLVRRLAVEAKANDGWNGLLVGDLAQPRGGPMLTGHRSHQIGLDADIWFRPMPARRLTRRERERMSAISMLSRDRLSVNPKIWTMSHVKLIRRTASYKDVERVLVHPAIKKALCEGADKLGGSRAWLSKVRPYWGHHYHFHIRIACPPGSPNCRPQKPTKPGDGCTAELAYWYRLLTRPKPKPVKPPKKKYRPRPPMTLARLPEACRDVLTASAKPQQRNPRRVPLPRPPVKSPVTPAKRLNIKPSIVPPAPKPVSRAK